MRTALQAAPRSQRCFETGARVSFVRVSVAHRLAASIFYALLACGASTGEIAEPVRQPAAASVSSTEAPPLPVVATPAAPPAAAKPKAVPPTGWFRSDSLCLELFANGDFELAVMGSGPKVLVIGGAKLAEAGDGAFTAELAVQRIWRARYTGPCRRTHQTGDFIDEKQALGITFAKGATAELRLARKDDDHVELCAQQCATLERDTPALGSRWRVAGLENPSAPTSAFTAGELLEIAIEPDGYSAHVWAAKDAKSWNDPYGAMTVEFRGDDRFAIEFTPGDSGDIAGGARVLGEPLVRGVPVTFAARRLPNERLEVCTTPDHCATLDRAFDAYDHDIR